MQPSGRICLQVAHHIRYRLVWPKLRENVNVIGHAVDRQQDTAETADRAADVFVEPRLYVSRDDRPPIFRREDNVIEEVRVRLGHRLALYRYRSRTRAWYGFSHCLPGLTPGP